MFKMYKKGQVVSIDFIASVVVFTLLIASVIFFWNLYSARFNANLEHDELTFKIVKITDLLVENQGVPTNWNETKVEVAGLVSKDRHLDADKLSSFKNLTYDEVKELFNIELYDFYFRIIDLNGALIEANGQFMEIGSMPPLDVDSVVKIRRIVLYGARKVIMEFSAWK